MFFESKRERERERELQREVEEKKKVPPGYGTLGEFEVEGFIWAFQFRAHLIYGLECPMGSNY